MQSIRIAIVDDHAVVRWALRQFLEKAGHIQIVGEASNGVEALALVRSVEPDVVLLDLSMPQKDGYEVLADLLGATPKPRVLMLTMHDAPAYAVRALRAGAHGFVQKNTDPTELLAAVETVARGETYFTDEVRHLNEVKNAAHPAHILSQRELEVMEHLARGLTNREIAERLTISIKTVDTHRGHVLKKLNLRNNSDITRYAIQHGYVPSI